LLLLPRVFGFFAYLKPVRSRLAFSGYDFLFRIENGEGGLLRQSCCHLVLSLVFHGFGEGPQRVRRHDAAVVILAEHDYEKLTGKKPDFKQFLLAEGPSFEGLDLTRDQSSPRQVKF